MNCHLETETPLTRTMKDGNTAPPLEEKTFAQRLKNAKVSRKFTLYEMAEVLRVPSDTLEGWLYREKTPPGPAQARALSILAREDLPPSLRARWDLQAHHGLTWDVSRHRYKFRATIDVGPKQVGRRICVSIRTFDAAVAIATRAAFLDGFRQLGLRIIERPQKRQKLPRT
jgi:DNA-binding transcriptional regulator YiaG